MNIFRYWKNNRLKIHNTKKNFIECQHNALWIDQKKLKSRETKYKKTF